MPFFQPTVTPLPEGASFAGRTAIVTGATAGLGLEISRQLLQRGVSTLVLAVRNVAKGEGLKRSLTAESSIKTVNPKAIVEVMKLDTEDYQSVKDFAKSFAVKHSELHLLMLNAGISLLKREMTPSGHEKNIQVNYLSNVLLLLELLPLLESTAVNTGTPTRATWTGSRMYATIKTSLSAKAPLSPGETLLEHFDSEDSFVPFSRYADSKLFVTLFLYELRAHYSSDKVIVNSFCPGMVDTDLTSVLPVYLRLPVSIYKALRARSPEKGGWIALHAALIVGPESHGQLLGDKDIFEPTEYIKSADGQKIQKMLWNETVDEIAKQTDVPAWMTKLS